MREPAKEAPKLNATTTLIGCSVYHKVLQASDLDQSEGAALKVAARAYLIDIMAVMFTGKQTNEF